MSAMQQCYIFSAFCINSLKVLRGFKFHFKSIKFSVWQVELSVDDLVMSYVSGPSTFRFVYSVGKLVASMIF
jgi:hypothetical protein